jgi:predicted nucleic acid-binding Zn ribbon protein
MKVFVYKCQKCGKKVEIPADQVPPKCHGETMKRDYSGINFFMKGGRFVGEVYHEKKVYD